MKSTAAKLVARALPLLALFPAFHQAEAGTTITLGADNSSFTDSTSYTDPTVSSIVKDGTGFVSLTGTNTYTGGTTINLGTLQIGKGGTVGSIVGNVTDSAILSFARKDAYTFSGVISGTGAVQQNGKGVLTLSGNSSYSGGTTLNAGTLSLGNSFAIGSGPFTIAKTAKIDAATAGLTLTAHQENWNANFTFVGTNDLDLGTGNVTMGKTRSVTISAGNLTVGGAISGTTTKVGLTKLGAGTLTLAGNNTYAGTTTIKAGTLNLGGSLGVGKVVNNGTLRFTADPLTFANIISGKGSVVQDGSDITLTGANTYTGGTTVASGTLILGNTAALGSSKGSVNVSGTLDLHGVNPIVARLTGGGTVKNDAAATIAALTVSNTSDTSFSGTLADGTGTLALVKTGKAALTLSGTNTYSGGTSLSGGTLFLNSAGALGTGALTIAAASTIDTGTAATLSNNPQNWNANFTFGGTSNLNLGTGDVTLNATRTVTVAANNLTVGGVISGPSDAGLTKAGSGNLILTGDNTYTGTTTISAGSLRIGNFGTTGSLGSGNVVDNSSLVFQRSDAIAVTNNISGKGTVVQFGSGSLVLSGNNTYSGGTVINGGTVIVGSANALGAATGSLEVNGTLDVRLSTTVGALISSPGSVIKNDLGIANLTTNSKEDTEVAGQIKDGTGDLGLIKSGTGTLTLSGANTYSNGTILNAGGLTINHATALGTGPLTINGGTLDNTSGGLITLTNDNEQFWNGNFTFKGTNALDLGNGAVTMNATHTITVTGSAPLTVGGVISGTASNVGLTKAGSGTLILTGDNSGGYTGTTTISAGTLQVGNGGTIGTLGTGDIVDNGTLAFNRSDDLTVSKNISGKGSLSQVGSNNLILTGTNTYSGGTSIASGKITLGEPGALGASSGKLTLTGGTLDLNALSLTIGALAGTGGTITNGRLTNETLTTNTSSSSEFAGIIQNGTGTIALVKSGTGILTLSGMNTYSGGTTLNAGGLNLNSAKAIGTGTFTIAGGTLDNTSGAAVALTTHNAQLWNANFTFKGTDDLDLGDGTITMNGTRTVTVTTAGSTLSVGKITATQSTYGLIKNGNGALALNGNNTYIGGTTLNAGELDLNNAGSLGLTGAFLIAGVSTIDNTSGSTVHLATNNLINWNADFTFNGTNDLDLGTGSVLMNANRIVTINAGTLTFRGDVGGPTFSLTQKGAGTLVLAGQNTFNGSLTISTGGTVQLGNGITNGSLASPTIANDGTLAFNQPIGATFATPISGKGGLEQDGTNILTLTGANTYTGGTVVNSGTLQVGGASALGSASASMTVNTGGTLDINGFNTKVGLLSGSGGTITNSDATARIFTTTSNADSTFAGTIVNGTSSVALTKSGSGNLTLTGNSTYTGQTKITDGTLTLGNGGTTGSLAGPTISNNSVLAINHSNAFTYSGVISGTGSVQQNGSGATTLSGANTHSGGTVVNAGTLVVANATALGSGNLTLNAGTLKTDGVIHTINVDGDLKWDSSAVIHLTLTPDADSELVAITGKLVALDGGPFTFDFTPVGLPPGTNNFIVMTATKGFGTLTGANFIFTSSDPDLEGTFSIVGNSLWFNDGYGDHGDSNPGGFGTSDFSGPQPVPEPSTWAMLILGGAVLLFVRHCKARRA